MSESDGKRKPDDEDRIPSGRSSKVQVLILRDLRSGAYALMCSQRTEVWGNQIQLTKQEILKLREEKIKLRDEKKKLLQLLADGIFTKEEFNEKTKKVEAQIAETQKEIQATKAELKEMTKKFEETAQGNEFS